MIVLPKNTVCTTLVLYYAASGSVKVNHRQTTALHTSNILCGIPFVCRALTNADPETTGSRHCAVAGEVCSLLVMLLTVGVYIYVQNDVFIVYLYYQIISLWMILCASAPCDHTKNVKTKEHCNIIIE